MLAIELPPPPAELHPARVLLIVEQSILTSIADELMTYKEDITAEGGTVKIQPFSKEDSVENLKKLIINQYDDIDGSFLIGDLPTAWYEQSAFGREEVFPIDIFLMDLNAVWSDLDNNGVYDSHSPLNLTKYASRITGSSDKINSYFSRLHNYRTGNYEYLGGAFIFKDDDWFNTYRQSNFGLDRMYSHITIKESSSETQRENYLNHLSYDGADYAYQWIHSSPASLYVRDGDNYSVIRYYDIAANNIRSRFLNMFNCKGALFTQTNLAMTYLTETETGIALTGSTKVGGNYYPLEFHRSLTLGSSWGNAFKSWYNYYGKKDDQWFLGMVILGDPAITIRDAHLDRTLSRSSFLSIFPPDKETVKALSQNLIDFENLEETF